MSEDIYLRLREQLDQYSFGYPSTKSGVEFKILKKLFTEEEAELFLLLTLMLETPESIARRTGRDPKETASLLQQMGEKGLVFHLPKGDKSRYAAVPFVAGVYEFQLRDMDREFAELFEQYCDEAFNQATAGGADFLRPIPVNRSVDVSYAVAPYDSAREIVKGQKLIAVADCICRVQQGLIGQACDKPLEVCLMFGPSAQHFIGMNMARQVTVEEALDILTLSEEAGLVTQPVNAQNPSAMCGCCGDCCAVLKALNKQPCPAKMVVSNYYAAVNPDLCTVCEICLERCQMTAIIINDGDTAEINLDRCIGCGLCVTTCPEEALRLVLKPEDQRIAVPEKASRHREEMSRRRGKSLIPLALAE